MCLESQVPGNRQWLGWWPHPDFSDCVPWAPTLQVKHGAAPKVESQGHFLVSWRQWGMGQRCQCVPGHLLGRGTFQNVAWPQGQALQLERILAGAWVSRRVMDRVLCMERSPRQGWGCRRGRFGPGHGFQGEQERLNSQPLGRSGARRLPDHPLPPGQAPRQQGHLSCLRRPLRPLLKNLRLTRVFQVECGNWGMFTFSFQQTPVLPTMSGGEPSPTGLGDGSGGESEGGKEGGRQNMPLLSGGKVS